MTLLKRSTSVTWFSYPLRRLIQLEERQWVENVNEEIRQARRDLDQDPRSIDALIRLARLNRQREDFQSSDDCYSRILRMDEENLDALNGLAWNRMLRNEWDEAREILTRALGIDPLCSATLINQGWCHLASYHYSALLEPAGIVTKQSPENSDAWAQMGMGLDGSGGETGGTACYRKALELDPENIIAIVNLAREAGHTEASIPWLTRLTKLTPDMTHGWAGLAEVQASLGMVDESLGNWKKVLDLDPLRVDALEYRAFLLRVEGDEEGSRNFLYRINGFKPEECDGHLWQKFGNYGRDIREVLSFLKETIKGHPGSWYAHQTLGYLHETMDPPEYDKAIFHRLEVTKILPDDITPWMQCVKAFIRAGRAREAFETARGFIVRYPRAHILLKQCADSLKEAGLYRLAIDAFLEYDQLNPDNRYAWQKMAECYHQLGQLEGAVRSYEQVQDLSDDDDSANQMAYEGLVKVLYRHGRWDEGMKAADKGLRRHPESSELRRLKGMINEKIGDEKAARIQYRKSLELCPNNLESRIRLGAILVEQGSLNQASEHFKRILEIQSKNANAWNVIGEVFLESGLWKEALPYFEESLALDPCERRAGFNRVACLVRLRETKKALPALKEMLIRIKPLDRSYHDLVRGLKQCLVHCIEALNLDELQTLAPDLLAAVREADCVWQLKKTVEAMEEEANELAENEMERKKLASMIRFLMDGCNP